MIILFQIEVLDFLHFKLLYIYFCVDVFSFIFSNYFERNMNNSDTSSFLPWTVTVILSIVLSQYLNQLFLLQFDFQVHTTHFSKNNKSYKATITNEYHFQVFNGTMNDLPTEEPIIQTQKEVGLTPVQLKDFGLYTKNRRVSDVIIIRRV